MTDKEIVQALRCEARHKTSSNVGCKKCPYWEPEGLEEWQKLHGWTSCKVYQIISDAADAIERLSAENAALREKMPTPRDVIILDEDGREYIDYICPKCKETITQARKDVKTMILATRKYHEECGQPLKWPKPGEKYGSKYRGMPLPGEPEEGDNHGTTD